MYESEVVQTSYLNLHTIHCKQITTSSKEPYATLALARRVLFAVILCGREEPLAS